MYILIKRWLLGILLQQINNIFVKHTSSKDISFHYRFIWAVFYVMSHFRGRFQVTVIKWTMPQIQMSMLLKQYESVAMLKKKLHYYYYHYYNLHYRNLTHLFIKIQHQLICSMLPISIPQIIPLLQTVKAKYYYISAQHCNHKCVGTCLNNLVPLLECPPIQKLLQKPNCHGKILSQPSCIPLFFISRMEFDEIRWYYSWQSDPSSVHTTLSGVVWNQMTSQDLDTLPTSEI